MEVAGRSTVVKVTTGAGLRAQPSTYVFEHLGTHALLFGIHDGVAHMAL